MDPQLKRSTNNQIDKSLGLLGFAQDSINKKQTLKNGYGAPTSNAPHCAWKHKGAKQGALHRKQKRRKTMQCGCLLRLPRKKAQVRPLVSLGFNECSRELPLNNRRASREDERAEKAASYSIVWGGVVLYIWITTQFRKSSMK